MSDIFHKQKRSEIMSKVSSKETKPEILVRKHLFKHGFRYRKNDRRYPGKPDIVLPKYQVAIFVHGCFWHGHKNCKYAKLPKSNIQYWKNKIKGNIIRDKEHTMRLKELGLKVIIIWSCSLKRPLLNESLQNLISDIR